ncbi:nidogen-2 isoform X1 [Tachysurus vachellii]|uniref:nidogen-2 isoform X1 n=1 Tax=Tachysurus vachellii TaxID=175792 RepID=UPI00296B55C8|nr:nidogen-2 isoform X1 [Tachysurus vachellii]
MEGRFIPAQIPVDTESSIIEQTGPTERRSQCIADKTEKVTMWKKAAVFLLQLSVMSHHVSALQRGELFPYGPHNGDLILQEGDDETSQVITLTKPMRFYDTSFSKLYVATNGIISPHDLPMEKQYVDDGFPTEFPVIAPFLADIDTSNGKGAIYYRQTESPAVLNRVAAEVQKGFPGSQFTPTHAVIATWENVAAYKEDTRTADSSRQVNTFQAVVAYDEENTYALFLYPEDGLQFFGTRPKEMFNVAIELPARVGFTRGEISYLLFARTEGPYYSLTTNEQSIKNLYQTSNTDVPGVWLFHIGNAHYFRNVIPAAVSGLLPAAVAQKQSFQTTPAYPLGEYETDDESFEDEQEYRFDRDFPNTDVTEFPQPGHDVSRTSGQNQEADSNPSPLDLYEAEATLSPDLQTEHTAPTNVPPEDSVHPAPGHTLLEAYPIHPEGEVVNVEEDVNFDTGVFHYSTENKETCDRFQQTCSQNAYCADYPSGYCCHCLAGFYGNGRHCLPDGAPQRVNGKVIGIVSVGSTPVGLDSIDLHVYIVVGDGRAYTAISEVPEPLGWALMPITPIGGLFGWLFALKLPNSHNGFNVTGAEFTRHADVTFSPGNQRLTIVQTGRGLDSQNYLNVETRLEGSVPFVPPGASIQMEPFSETYQYYPSLITSNSVREFTIVSASSGAEKFTYQLRQNITYRDCRHTQHAGAETLQLNVERVFAMYVKEERVLRYAITNKIGHVGGYVPDPVKVNPCYLGSHDCDTTAQCVPGEGQHFTCVCATGYTGDGRNCYDVDECTEGLSSCGRHAECVNLPGSHRCQCQSGFEYGHDSRTCIDVDECQRHPCHPHASCTNVVGSFHCQCQPGFHGDGFQCHRQQIDEERPKTQCEHHRDSAQSGVDSVPVWGAYVPQCDEQGHYRSQQCHGSTGYCWCVDSRGQERAGTRTPPGTPAHNCDTPVDEVHPKTRCEHHRDSAERGVDGVPMLGAYVPQCDEKGHYRSQQCHDSTGYCWCVDSEGRERAGTQTPPGSPLTNCDAPERLKTQCEQHRHDIQGRPGGSPLAGEFIPDCDEEGNYRPRQCDGSTGHCWCVDSKGQERADTRTLPGTPPINCDTPGRPKTQCEQHRHSAQHGADSALGAYIPECDEEGRYRSLQCHGSTGHCWCVDNRGQERVGTRTPPGTQPTDCDAPERPKTQCEQHRDSIHGRGDGLPLVGAFVPQCDEEGRYKSEQCHGSTGHCWCVDSTGRERAGTRTPPGTPNVDCDAPERPKTQCEQHRDSIHGRGDGLPLVGAFVPQCDEEGRYKSEQCHGSTGHCWCVDSTGRERAGTRTPPGTPNVDCDAPVHPERPNTHCEQHREAEKSRVNRLDIVGAYIPQCDQEGHYRPQQCHGSTGHCWCVDSKGQERAGTRTPPGTPPINCDTPGRPKTQCEQHRHSAQHGADSALGAYIPECDEEGRYRSLQCHGSTGHCWCVDNRGQERVGTRTPPGTQPTDCDAPERPKTQCEQHRDSIHGRGDGLPLVGAFVPQCDEEGRYKSEQCHGSTGHCWCVDSTGRERAGTRTPPGTPNVDCDAPERPKTQCEQHRDSIHGRGDGLPLVGAFVPQCDEEGRYKSEQCHGSTGHCWCVDSTGRERAGTRTPPGTPNVDCDAPARPKTLCEQHRDRAQSRAHGSPGVGAFIPQCDQEGHYMPLQCHGSTGHCWCVDSRGQERSGTRTPPGSPQRNCDAPVEVVPTQRSETVCERWRASLIQQYGGRPGPEHFLPQCDASGEFTPVQCYGDTNYCWCVDRDGREVPGTRSHDKVKPACIPTVPPPTVRPLPRPDVTPPPSGTTLLYAQGQQIGALPLNGTRMDKERSSVLLALHGSIVVGIDYDCRERKVYWTDLAGRTISRAALEPGSEPEILISSGLMSPEGLAVDEVRRRMFWVDSTPDKIETAKLDGSDRRVLFSSDLVNPRAIVVDSLSGTLYWTDWNREAPKIETSTVEGQNRRILVRDGIGLPNALTIDPTTRRICWADAGTKRLECIAPDGTGRRVIHSELNYPFSMVLYANHFYYTDWRRDGVIGLSRDSSHFTDEYLPDQRSHLYGITVAPSSCL